MGSEKMKNKEEFDAQHAESKERALGLLKKSAGFLIVCTSTDGDERSVNIGMCGGPLEMLAIYEHMDTAKEHLQKDLMKLGLKILLEKISSPDKEDTDASKAADSPGNSESPQGPQQ